MLCLKSITDICVSFNFMIYFQLQYLLRCYFSGNCLNSVFFCLHWQKIKSSESDLESWDLKKKWYGGGKDIFNICHSLSIASLNKRYTKINDSVVICYRRRHNVVIERRHNVIERRHNVVITPLLFPACHVLAVCVYDTRWLGGPLQGVHQHHQLTRPTEEHWNPSVRGCGVFFTVYHDSRLHLCQFGGGCGGDQLGEWQSFGTCTMEYPLYYSKSFAKHDVS